MYFSLIQKEFNILKIYKYTVGQMGTNCYFAVDENTLETMVIDPGAEFEKISSVIKTKGLRVIKILLTHAHFDHMLALEELRESTSAPLLIHKDDGEQLCNPEKNLLIRFSGERFSPKPAEMLLSDGDKITVGNSSFTVMHTPGHTPGSICLVSEDTIISGDTLFRESIGRYDFPGGDYNLIMKSLEKIKSLDFNYKILPGHGPSTHLQHEKQNNLYLQ